jgi:hypothetical protein
MDKVISFLNNKYFIAIIVALFLYAVIRKVA